ncbi:MAG: YcjX family protein [Hyphomicrobiales bacterium]|nr:YcjX family protein [Hyphomicrobiales bacterium]
MANAGWLPPFLTQASDQIVSGLRDLAGGSTVWLAVTGLSRSGKTVFITSLIHNLLSAAHNPNRMPLLNVVGEGRLLAANLDSAKAQRLPRFPYRSNIERMALQDWPDRTADISEIGVEARFAPAGAIGKLMSEITGSPASLTIRIVDYPGEWLLDLPLLTQSYAQWARSTMRLLRKGARAPLAGEFLAFQAANAADAAASEETAKRAHDLYCAFLVRARDECGLSLLQPGRFLCRGSLGDVPYLWFAPIDVSEDVEGFAPHSLGALMAERFEVYKREAVARFYENHFRHYSRQIVLVDVLRALLAGRDAFDDTRLALDAILDSFRYGHGGVLSKLLFGSHIDRVLFAATKADHVPDIQRDHLAALLRNMAAFPALEVKSSNAQLDVTALAAVISTAEGSQEIDGHRVQVVVGRPVGARTQSKFFVGNVPIRPPRPDAWGQPFLNVPVFEPPAIDPSPVEGIPHINLDTSLEFLLGDRLR